MPRLIVIKGTDEGRQFVLADELAPIGRDATSRIRLTDTEVSRRHAEFFRTKEGYRVRDLGSANGTFVNGRSIKDVLLQAGDHIQVGQTVAVYTLDRGEAAPDRAATSDLAERISMITKQDMELSSAIVKTVNELEGSRILAHPDKVDGPWLRNAQALGVLYEATQLSSQTLDTDQLLERILDLIFRTLQADRGCILLRTSDPLMDTSEHGPDLGPVSIKEFEPRALRIRDGVSKQEKLPVSRTVVEYVLHEKKGILVSDAMRDERFQAVQSIVRSGIREVICVPMKGRHQTLGVMYLDTATVAAQLIAGKQSGKFSGDHLNLAIAIAHVAALAVEETRYYQAMVNAERLAAVGQTVAALSHDLKNILQGLGMGGQILEMGIASTDQELLQKGWRILSKNQSRIKDLVMNMLSFSKAREPDIEEVDLNELVEDVVEIVQGKANENQILLSTKLDDSLPLVPADRLGMHRAILNIVGNAIDAILDADTEEKRVVIGTSRDPILDPTRGPNVRVQVLDTGTGIEPEKLNSLFRPFSSTKGSRGTGLGLAVSRKILREHGGDITVESKVGKGSIFTLRLPLRSPIGDLQGTRTDIPIMPGPPD